VTYNLSAMRANTVLLTVMRNRATPDANTVGVQKSGIVKVCYTIL